MHSKNPIATPLHLGTINGASVRLFESPLKDGKPDFPWVCLSDLMAAYGLSDRLLQFAQSKLHQIAAEAMEVATLDGLVTLIPHPDAQGFVHAMTKLQGINAEEDYKAAGAAALKKQLSDMTDKQAMAYFQAAVERWKE